MSSERIPKSRLDAIGEVIASAKALAIRYRELTGKPLGITGEVAEYEAARILGLELCPARQAGFDAIGTGDRAGQRIQVKGRCLADGAKRGQRIGSIKLDHPWDVVLLVTLDANFSPVTIHQAERRSIKVALSEPGSKARNVRGALSMTAFRKLGSLVWEASAK